MKRADEKKPPTIQQQASFDHFQTPEPILGRRFSDQIHPKHQKLHFDASRIEDSTNLRNNQIPPLLLE